MLLIDDLRIGGSDHTHKTAHYSDLTAAPSSRNSGGRSQSITGRANAMAELIARITALLRRPGGALGMTLEASNVRLDTVGRELTIGGIPVGCAEEYQPKPRIDAGEDRRCRNRGFELHQYGRLHQAGGQLRNARSNSRF